MASAQAPPTHEDIAKVAYHLWEERGAPIGSPEVDWRRAEQELSAASGGRDDRARRSRRPARQVSLERAPRGRAQRVSAHAAPPHRRRST
jgi:hypothetical protein